MVFCGVVSKGCERCRQRKVKCDQRKPRCRRCERSHDPCPGYRNLDEVIFRDESRQVMRKARKTEQQMPSIWKRKHIVNSSMSISLASRPILHDHASTGITRPLHQAVDEVGANFFFAKYIYNELPFSTDYHSWLIDSYQNNCKPNNILRIIIEALGLAGISNTSYAPDVAMMSMKRYSTALNAMRLALSDPIQLMADETLLATIYLAFFESVAFEGCHRYPHWKAHVNAASALLMLRDNQQFNRDRGAQLYIQCRSQILQACLQQHLPVPATLVRSTYAFENSLVRKSWQHQKVASPASISEISFRVVNLRASIANGEIVGLTAIRSTVLQIDADLEAWRDSVPKSWKYAIIDSSDENCFDGKCHSYPNLWVAHAWNNWRGLRICINQLTMEDNLWSRFSPSEDTKPERAIKLVQELSRDLCISVASFEGKPLLASLIRPLHAVAKERWNEVGVRNFAIQALQSINRELGIREAAVLAESVIKEESSIFSKQQHCSLKPKYE